MTDDDSEYEDDTGCDDEFEFDCHMHPDGQCGAAGSEMCDFECPVMAEIHRQQYQQRARARAKKRSKGGRQTQLHLPLTDQRKPMEGCDG